MAVLSGLRESKLFKAIADISVVHWFVTIIPGLLSGIEAAMHGNPLEVVILYFVGVSALMLVVLHYGALALAKYWPKIKLDTANQSPNKLWRLIIPAVALGVVFGIVWFFRLKPPQTTTQALGNTKPEAAVTVNQSAPLPTAHQVQPPSPTQTQGPVAPQQPQVRNKGKKRKQESAVASQPIPKQEQQGTTTNAPENSAGSVIPNVPQSGTLNYAPNGFATSGGTLFNPTINNYEKAEPQFHWTEQELTREQGGDPEHPEIVIRIKLDSDSMTDAAFVAKCDRPCKTTSGIVPRV